MTLQATVALASTGSAVPNGPINFYDGDPANRGTLLGSATLNSQGVATFVTAGLSAESSAHQIYAEYDPTESSGFAPSESPESASVMVSPKTLFVSGLNASNKLYDGTRSAELSGTAALLPTEPLGSGSATDGRPYANGLVNLASMAASSFTGAFATKNAATGIVVDVTGDSLSGSQAGDYVLSGTDEENSAVTANITPKPLTYTGLSAPASKVYDGTSAAVVSGTGTLQSPEAPGSGSSADGKPYSGDQVSLTGTPTATYNSKDVATATTVTFAGLSLSGSASGDYSLLGLIQAATITPKALSYSGLSAPASKVYDGTTAAVVSGTGAPSHQRLRAAAVPLTASRTAVIR